MSDQEAIDKELKSYEDMKLNKFYDHHGPIASDRIGVLNGFPSSYRQEYIIENKEVIWKSSEEENWNERKYGKYCAVRPSAGPGCNEEIHAYFIKNYKVSYDAIEKRSGALLAQQIHCDAQNSLFSKQDDKNARKGLYSILAGIILAPIIWKVCSFLISTICSMYADYWEIFN